MKNAQMDRETRRIISGFVDVLREYNAQNVYKRHLDDEETINENEMKNAYCAKVSDVIATIPQKEWHKHLETYDDYIKGYYDLYDCLYNELYNDFYENAYNGGNWRIRNEYGHKVNEDYQNPNYSNIANCYDELADLIFKRASNKAREDMESEENE